MTIDKQLYFDNNNLRKLKNIVARKIDNCYNINVKIKEQRTAKQMNKIVENTDIKYIKSFNLIRNLYNYKTILKNLKMYAQKQSFLCIIKF